VIYGVAITFGVLAIVLMVVGASILLIKAMDWWNRRQEVRRMTRLRKESEK
jgi:hypothetical protein